MAADSVVNDPNGSNYSLGRGVDQQQLDELLTKSSQMVMSAPTAPRNIQTPSPVDINPNYGLPVNVGTSSSGDPIFVSRGGAYPLALLDREFQYNRELDLAKQQARSMEVAKARKAAEETKLEFVDMSHKNWQEALNESLYSETMSRYDAYLNHFSKIDPETAADRARIASTKDFDYQFRIQRYKTLAKGMDDVLTKATDVLETLPMTTKVDGKERSGGYYSEQTRSLAAQLTVLPANGAIDLDKAYQLVNTFKRNVAAKDVADDISGGFSKQVVGKLRKEAGNMSAELFATYTSTNSDNIIKEYMPKMLDSAMFNYKDDPSLVESWAPNGKYSLTEEGKKLQSMMQEFIETGIKQEIKRDSDQLQNDEMELAKAGLNSDGTIGGGDGSIPVVTPYGNYTTLLAKNYQAFAPAPLTIMPAGPGDSFDKMRKTNAVYISELGKWVVPNEPMTITAKGTGLVNISEVNRGLGKNYPTSAKDEANVLWKGDNGSNYTRVVEATFTPQGKSNTKVSRYSEKDAQESTTATSIQSSSPVPFSYRELNPDGTLTEVKTMNIPAGVSYSVLAGGDERMVRAIANTKGNETMRNQIAIADSKGVNIFSKDAEYMKSSEPVKKSGKKAY